MFQLSLLLRPLPSLVLLLLPLSLAQRLLVQQSHLVKQLHLLTITPDELV